MKQHAPSADRNKHEILPVLQLLLPQRGRLLELAGGTGQHAAHFAAHFPELEWQPSDRDSEALGSLEAYRQEAGLPNWQPALELDVRREPWPVEPASLAAALCINMLHISPWESCQGLFRGVAQTLAPGAALHYYGAFFRRDRQTAPSNLDFDASLRARDPDWGVRDLEAVCEVASAAGVPLERVLDMPNNNYFAVFRRPAAD